MSQRDSLRTLSAGFLAALLASCAPQIVPTSTADAENQPVAQDGLQAWVSEARSEHQIIALGAVVASSEGIIEISVDGVRALDTNDPVQVADKWHLGSNTKALTALLYAQLVEQGLAEWSASLPDLFPDLAPDIDPAWSEITIEDLLAHRSGMMQMGGFWLNARRNDKRPVSEQRAEATRNVLINPPSKTQGEFDYNNLNYIVAGAAIERILRAQSALPDTWEGAMQEMLFNTLPGATLQQGFGFGAPQEGLAGHRIILGAFPTAVGRGKTADNPAILGPAGTLHGTLASHATVALEFLKDDSSLISLEMREKLFSPYPDSDSQYAMGWGVYEDPKYGTLYVHSGSNTMWYSRIAISPNLDRVVIVNANQFSDGAQSAAAEVTAAAFDEALASQSDQ